MLGIAAGAGTRCMSLSPPAPILLLTPSSCQLSHGGWQ